MVDRIAWFNLAAAALMVRAFWLHPRGPHTQRGGYSIAASVALLGIVRLVALPGLAEIAAQIAIAGLTLVGIVSFVFAFRSGELALKRGKP